MGQDVLSFELVTHAKLNNSQNQNFSHVINTLYEG